MTPHDSDRPEPAPEGLLNEKTVRLLEKALALAPEDWETRGHLISHYLAANDLSRATTLLKQAPTAPGDEADLLIQARVEARVDPSSGIVTLQQILQRNKACAVAYLLLARIYREQGMKEDAAKKYGAATLLDEQLADPEFELWLGNASRPVNPHPPVVIAAQGADDDDGVLSDEEIADAVKAATSPDEPARPRATFDDIGGMEDVIERIRMNIIYPFKNPSLFQKFNRRSGGGILLYGPPGCGKTHIARATAGECNATFLPIAITDVLSKWLGESERHLHELFETARRRSPTVIFIDEIDAIGMSRSDASSSLAPLVNVLLTEMDGIAADNQNVMILGATNSPWRVDSALRRPGRFDRVLFVPPPDATARQAILDIHLRGVPAQGLDLAKIVKVTDKFSGADLKALISRAAEQAIIAEMRTGKSTEVTQRMLLDALKGMRPSTEEWLETARNYASYSNRAGIYDDLVAYFEGR